MDQERFDHLARDLSSGITRRGMKHGEVDIRINGVASEFSFVDC